MLDFLLIILAQAGVLLLLAKYLPNIQVTDFGHALLVALVVSVLNATLGFLLRLPMNLLTFGFIAFLVRLVVSTIMVKLASRVFKSFEVKGWGSALIVAIALALTTGLLERLFLD